MGHTIPGGEAAVVLVVDDDSFLRRTTCDALTESGFLVREANNGHQALAQVRRSPPDIVLLDVVMPDLDGFATCVELRRIPGAEHLPVIMITSLDDSDSITRSYEVGATDFITKPINYQILHQRLRYLLRAGQAFRDLHRSEARLAQAQRLARLGNWELDIVHDRLWLSSEARNILCGENQKPPTCYEDFLALVHPEDRSTVATAVAEALSGHRPLNIDHRITLPNGEEHYLHDQAETYFDGSGKPILLFGTFQDISERKQAEEQIRYLAYYDSLTGLPNRALFHERVSYILAHAERYRHQVGLLFLDLDRFKLVNDSLGHTMGDLLLQKVAERLSRALRPTDLLSHPAKEELSHAVARLGGDEFTLWLTDITHVQDVVKIARRILDGFSEPFPLGNQEVFITASIGIALYPSDGKDVETLLKNADSAMYHAKDRGKNTYQFYSETMNAAARRMLALENSLRRALERNELRLVYQPLVDLSSGKISGAEALLRWVHGGREIIPPSDFIPLAEETGMILPIGEWVLGSACAQAGQWQAQGLPPLTVAVNLSSRQFWEDSLSTTVAGILDKTGLDPETLNLEITENILMQDSPSTGKTLQALKGLGVKISLDDFGTGYSSLSYLKQFPLDFLKIDQSFVQDIDACGKDMAIVSAIIAMAHGLNLEVVAEGVETSVQLDLLRHRGCEKTQGFLFAEPLSSEDFVTFYHAWKGLPEGVASTAGESNFEGLGH